MSSMAIKLHVEMEDGLQFDVVADQRDFAKWEVQPFGRPFEQFEERAMTGLRFLAYSAAVRGGLTDLFKWDDFDAKCVEVMPPDDEEEGADPLAGSPGRPKPSVTPTSRSRSKRANP